MPELAAVIHLSKQESGQEPDRFTDKGPTIDKAAKALCASGLRVILTRGVADYDPRDDPKEGSFKGWPYLEGSMGQRFSQEVIGVIRDHAGTLGRVSESGTQSAQGLTLEQSGVAILNGPSVRRLEKLGFVMPTDAEVAALGGRNLGRELTEAAGEIDFSSPFPDAIQFIDDRSRRMAEQLAGNPKAVRMFFFFGKNGDGALADELETLAVARFSRINPETGKLEATNYAYIDNDRVKLAPLIAMTLKRAQQIAQKSGQQEISGAFDLLYGISAGQVAPEWHYGKDSLWQPVPPRGEDENTQFVDMTVRQMERIINSKESGK